VTINNDFLNSSLASGVTSLKKNRVFILAVLNKVYLLDSFHCRYAVVSFKEEPRLILCVVARDVLV